MIIVIVIKNHLGIVSEVRMAASKVVAILGKLTEEDDDNEYDDDTDDDDDDNNNHDNDMKVGRVRRGSLV